MKVCIGIPSHGDIKIPTMLSLFSMISHAKVPVMISTRMGCYVHENREEIVKDALKNDCTHLMFIDTDMKFPSDTLTRLLAHGKDIVGAHYNGRTMPKHSLVMQFVGDQLERIKTVPDKLFKAAVVPTGCMLIDMNVFKRIDFPRFFFELDAKNESMAIGEDVYFCLKAQDKGCKVWCDPTIDCKHIGEYEY